MSNPERRAVRTHQQFGSNMPDVLDQARAAGLRAKAEIQKTGITAWWANSKDAATKYGYPVGHPGHWTFRSGFDQE